MTVVVLTGPIASGKSSLTRGLHNDGWAVFSTRLAIKKLLGQGTREELQERGQALDSQRPNWIYEVLAEEFADKFQSQHVVVDSARRIEQIDLLRESLRGKAQVVHVHLWAPDHELRSRYDRRDEETGYEKAKSDTLESSINDLAKEADLVIDTSRCTAADTLMRVVCFLDLGTEQSNYQPNVDVLVGGQYGSEGKGHIVAHIAPEYDMLIRVGGPNAGHTVLYKGKKVSFYHLPSGCLHSPQATLVLGAGININPKVLEKEIELAESLGVSIRDRLVIDRNANIITGDDIERENALVGSIGSTGQGVGSATASRIMGRATRERALAQDFYDTQDAQEVYNYAYHVGSKVLLEGTQGTGLSLYHGPYPYVTSRDTTASGTMADAGIAPHRIRKVIMVIRTNPIRVQSPNEGTSGPMGKEISWDDVAVRSGVDAELLREREKTTTTKRQRRVSEFDWVLLRRSSNLNLPTDLALTFADYLSPENTKARRFEQLTPETQSFIKEVECVARAPVTMITTRLHERSIIDLRRW